jgi:nucleoid DNA-binding protein
MRKPELIDELAKAAGLTKQESAGIVETVFECITAALNRRLPRAPPGRPR